MPMESVEFSVTKRIDDTVYVLQTFPVPVSVDKNSAPGKFWSVMDNKRDSLNTVLLCIKVKPHGLRGGEWGKQRS